MTSSQPSTPRAGRTNDELLGVRRWLQRTFVGPGLDDEPDTSDLGREAGRLEPEPALGHGSGQDLAQTLAVARSLTDKFLVLCLIDDSLHSLYSNAASRLLTLKRDLAETILSALRAGGTEDFGNRPLCLEAHKGLKEDHVRRLGSHLRSAVLEHCEALRTFEGFPSAESFADTLLATPGMPVSLLPRQDAVSERTIQGNALQSKGGEDAAVRVLPGGIELAPLSVPLKRRRQMFACVLGTGLIPGAVGLLCSLLYYWRKSWPFLVPYLTYSFIIDKSPFKGGMKISPMLRRAWIFKHWAAYFPASLIKANPSADFDGTRPMLMGYHPHGILSFGAQLNFGTDCTGWAEKFPNLTPRLCTLNMNLTMPFLREIIGRLGAIPADAGAIRSALKPGNAVILVVGGAAEALDTKPGEYVLTLARRKGFFRLALQHGADLVPSFGFGENDLFETLTPNSLLRTLQLKAYKILSFSMPIFYGRGVFTYNMGLLPFRRPLTVVVGDPIRCEQTPNPTAEQIDALKEQYISALRDLYKEWAPRLEPGRDASLMVI
mmetsp:Transcript_29779/g.78432  ORF Transcript_29779/g.78432 Transcript_29779/m.78432 type:complete len:548 (+) Transcript_29779:82-1725(+)